MTRTQEVDALAPVGVLGRLRKLALELREAGRLRRGTWARCERSGSYRSSSVAWVMASDLPLDIGCSGLPSSLIGRNSSDFTSMGSAPVGNGCAVAKNIGLPRIRSSGCFTCTGRWARPAAWCNPRDRPCAKRRAHDLQEAAAADRIDPLAGGTSLSRKLFAASVPGTAASPPARPGSSRSACRSWPSSFGREPPPASTSPARIAVTTCAADLFQPSSHCSRAHLDHRWQTSRSWKARWRCGCGTAAADIGQARFGW